MMSDRSNPDDLESLSALFDGELDAEAARFARKRLGHDLQWQQACGRWQLIGDALRGQATAAAPADFAGRVSAAVATEPVPVPEPLPVPVPTRSAARAGGRGRQRLWLGSALAASMALVAVFVARPPVVQTGTDASYAATVPSNTSVSSGGASAIAAPQVAEPPAGFAAAPVDASPSDTETVPAPASSRPYPRSDVRAARDSTARIAREVQQRASAAVGDPEPVRVALAEDAAHPFRPKTEIVTRPWPRAVLPNSQAAGALTASFDAPNTAARSFYPFEPQPAADPSGSAVRQP